MTIPYFSKYVIKRKVDLVKNPVNVDCKRQIPYTREDLGEAIGLDAGDRISEWDKRILYEVTGVRVGQDDYRDETSDDYEYEDDGFDRSSSRANSFAFQAGFLSQEGLEWIDQEEEDSHKKRRSNTSELLVGIQ